MTCNLAGTNILEVYANPTSSETDLKNSKSLHSCTKMQNKNRIK